MADDFYKNFEDRYRGPREMIKTRLRVYFPFIKPLLQFYPDAKAIDLGCGRGEWLELLLELGICGTGIDINEGKFTNCQNQGFTVHKGDAWSFLKKQASNSQLIISGFHIAEHLPFIDLQAIFKESLRVLQPGGLLILETPNPENITVGTVNFWLDPTHIHPLPPLLLEFLSENSGFCRTKLLRLQESADLSNKANIGLIDVIAGVSPDYAIVAQKSGGEPILTCINDPFSLYYGTTLGALANSYDNVMEKKIYSLNLELDRVRTMVESTIAGMAAMNLKLEKIDKGIKFTSKFLTYLVAVYAYITQPLRWASNGATRLLSLIRTKITKSSATQCKLQSLSSRERHIYHQLKNTATLNKKKVL